MYQRISVDNMFRVFLKRIYNAFILAISYRLSVILKKPVVYGKPWGISLETSSVCNLRCPQCPVGLGEIYRENTFISITIVDKILQELNDSLIHANLYFQGEPYLNPDLFEIIKRFKQHHVFTTVSTNGQVMDEETAKKTVLSGVDRLIVSMDGNTQDTYEKYRKGGNLEKALSTIRLIRVWKKKLRKRKPKIISQCLIMKHNEDKLTEIAKLAKNAGADNVSLKSMQLTDFHSGDEILPKNQKYARYNKISESEYTFKKDVPNRCRRLWHSVVITSDGGVVPCCFDKKAQHVMGSLPDSPFGEIWKNDQYQGFRQKVLQKRQEIDICRNCCEGIKVEF